jgi:tripartite-type tricarboxylate transporter receptor subunit TctC
LEKPTATVSATHAKRALSRTNCKKEGETATEFSFNPYGTFWQTEIAMATLRSNLALSSKYSLLLLSLVFALSVTRSIPATANDYPTRPIHLIVPFAPGGAADFIGRILAKGLEKSLRATFVIENRGGASSNIGANYVASSTPDGYTLLLVPANFVVNVSLYKDFRLDPEKDLAPISLVAYSPNILVVHPGVAAKSVKELVDLLKANPGSMSFASSGEGSPAHLAVVQLEILTGTSMIHIPYGRGAGTAVSDLLSGRVQVMMGVPPAVLDHAKKGTLRPLATTSKARLRTLPEVPTMVEAGVQGFDLDNWYGLAAPGGTPDAVIAKLSKAVRETLASQDVQDRFADMGITTAYTSPTEFGRMMATEIPRYKEFMKAAKIAPH